MERIIVGVWAGVRAVGWALTLACATAAAQGSPPQEFTPEQIRTGAELYERYCSACHGARMEEIGRAHV